MRILATVKAVEIFTAHGQPVKVISQSAEGELTCTDCGHRCRYAAAIIGNSIYCAWHVPGPFTFDVDISLQHLVYEAELKRKHK